MNIASPGQWVRSAQLPNYSITHLIIASENEDEAFKLYGRVVVDSNKYKTNVALVPFSHFEIAQRKNIEIIFDKLE